jgi:hypothetical protein
MDEDVNVPSDEIVPEDALSTPADEGGGDTEEGEETGNEIEE